MKKLVSIIVPVYGVEAYLEECLDSLITQTYKNLEIILIDDESPDRCPQICDEYAEKDNRIKVIHQKNGGAGKARNTGLSQIQGEYVCFVDSDDYVQDNYIEILVKLLEENCADISVANYYLVYRNNVIAEHKNENKIFTEKQYILHFLNNWSCGLLWNKMFKRSLLEEIQFVENRKIDDEFFTYKVVLKAKRIVTCDQYIYYYRMRASSVMSMKNTYFERIIQDQHDYLYERYRDVIRVFPEIQNEYLFNLMDNFIILLRKSNGYSNIRKQIRKTAYHMLPDILLSKMSMKVKLVFFFNLFIFPKSVKTPHEIDNEMMFL